MPKAIQLVLLLFLLSLCHAAAAQQTLYVAPSAGANLRSAAGTNSAVVATLPANTELKVLSKEGDWYRVEANGRTGYMHSSTVSERRSSSGSSGSQSNSSNSRNRDSRSGSKNNNNSGRRSSSGSGSSSSGGQVYNWGIGARFGDPSGLTVKRYMGNKALEFNIGRTHMFWYGRDWYDKRFDRWYDKRKPHYYRDYHYLGYEASLPLGLQVHYLVHKNLLNGGDDAGTGLLLYYGAGVQLRHQTYYYTYRYKVDGRNDWVYVHRDRVSDFGIGVDGVLGLEYKFLEAPISVFTDVTLFMEVADDPFLFWLQPGIGVRYNF